MLGFCTLAAGCSPVPDLFTTPETYAFGGTVTDAVSGAPVSGVLIKARTVPGDSELVIASATSGPDGNYRLLGLPSGVIHLQLDKYRYLQANESIEMTTKGRRNFSLAPNPSVPDLNGSHTLTIEANAGCATATNPLPPELRLRTFTAQVEHVGQNLTVRVQTVQTQWDAGGFVGVASNSGAQFWMATHDEFGITVEDFVERILPSNKVDPTEHLVFLGAATTKYSATGLLGTLDGTITYYKNINPFPFPRQFVGSCGAARFELAR